ncbi:MAG: type I-E CRISPR-associated protein Cas6/Cse3/CasE [Candidatus Omnitrophota bacterium]|nr:type I-E CRISPR-associated protein Cas6/Cse3/CasE [Candidatus Omnitrophota bacterium]
MYISKISLNESSVFKEIFASGYALHQAVWDLFADRPDRKRDFLYRLDTFGKIPQGYTVSARKPQDADCIWHIDSKEYTPQVKFGMRIGFTVRVNPVVKREGKRHDVVMDAKYKMRATASGQITVKAAQEIITEACGKWIEERAEKNGFIVLKHDDELMFRVDGYQQVRFYKPKGEELIRYSTVDITGALEVVNEQSFTDMLLGGFGPAKGFGCGLMMVRRI